MAPRRRFESQSPTNSGQNLETRKWLGCVAWDGHPENFEQFADCTTEEQFAEAVKALAARDDFCDPAKHGFPFPWTRDLFLTDCTYALMDGRVMMTTYHRGWIPLAEYLGSMGAAEAYHDRPEALPGDVPAPTETWDRGAPDSITIITGR